MLGVTLFGKVQFSGPHGRHANFRDFISAIVTLLRSMTGEGWNELMHELGHDQWHFESVQDRICEPEMDVQNNYQIYKENDQLGYNAVECGVGFAAQIYFIAFTMSVTFVVLNLFVAVILEGFDESTLNLEFELTNKCIEVWKKYDSFYKMQLPLAKGFEYIEEVCAMHSNFEGQVGQPPKVGLTAGCSWNKITSDAGSVNQGFFASLNLRRTRQIFKNAFEIEYRNRLID
jgi:hypothetical protein